MDAGRALSSVRLLAVSKTQPAGLIEQAFDAGQTAFGENFVQEGLEKIHLLSALPIEWHFIGAIQANKTKQIAENFHWVHGVDRLKIAERLSAQRPAHLDPLQVCIQVNVSGEASKAGAETEHVVELAKAMTRLPNLRLRGLMTIPAPATDFESQRLPFRALARLRTQLLDAGIAVDTLSMGMSGDLEAAIAEGATIVRVGTAVFGSRHLSL
jgi:pyridoxal phosphate enzyme (YggS family)